MMNTKKKPVKITIEGALPTCASNLALKLYRAARPLPLHKVGFCGTNEATLSAITRAKEHRGMFEGYRPEKKKYKVWTISDKMDAYLTLALVTYRHLTEIDCAAIAYWQFRGKDVN